MELEGVPYTIGVKMHSKIGHPNGASKSNNNISKNMHFPIFILDISKLPLYLISMKTIFLAIYMETHSREDHETSFVDMIKVGTNPLLESLQTPNYMRH